MSIFSRKTSINVFLLSINLILLGIIGRVVIADETTNAILEQSIYLYYYESDDALLDVSESQLYTFAPIPGEDITIVAYGLDDSALTSVSLFDNNSNLVATGTTNQVTDKPDDTDPSKQSPFITAIQYTANSSGLYYFEVKNESGKEGLIRTMLFVGEPFNTDLTLIDELNPLLPSKAFMIAGDSDREWENELTGETLQGLRTEVDVLPIERIDRAPDVFLSYSTLSYLPDVTERLEPVTFDRWFNEDNEEIYLVNIRPVPEKETDASRSILEDLDYQTYNSNNFFFFEYLFSVGNGSDPIALDRGAGACAGLADRIDCISSDPDLGREVSETVTEVFETTTLVDSTSEVSITGEVVTVTIDRTQTCTSFGGNTGNSVTISSVSGTPTTVCLPSRYIPATGTLVTTGITAPASGTQNVCSGTADDDVIACTTGDDWIEALAGDDAIFADAGNDDIFGGSGVDFIIAGSGNDNVDAGSGYDEVDGGAGNDNINLGADGGVAVGGTGADTFIIDSSHSTTGVSTTRISGGTSLTAAGAGDGEQDEFVFEGNPTGTIYLYTDTTDLFDFTNYGSGVTVYPDYISGPSLFGAVVGGGLPSNISGSASADTMNLGSGCVFFVASGCFSTNNYNIDGNAGNDAITTAGGSDTIDGGDDDDTINSGAGNDTIIMTDGDGNDTIDAGAGTDLIDGVSSTNALIVTLNNAVGSIVDTVTGDTDLVSNVENVNTGSGDDQFFISDNDNNIINAGGGDDVATVSGGIFTITVNRTGEDVAVSALGIGTDQFNSVAQMNVSGSIFNDTFIVNDENDNEFNGLGGTDSIDYATTSDDITVDFYTTFTAVVSGASIGNDTLINIERIATDSGNDDFIFNSDVGTVAISSRAGDDTFDFNDASGTLMLVDSSGNTFLDFTDYTDGANIDLGITSQQTVSLSDSSLLVTLNGGVFNNVSGSAFADSISGTTSSDTIYGGGDNDQIYGEFGNDFLYGEDGNDLIDGGFGNDTIDGGAGNDDIDGGFGTDFIDESGSTNDLVVTLSDVAGVGSIVDGAEVDTVDNVENIDTGSGLDTFIMSDSSNNIINAGGGDDVATVTGGAGTITVTRDGEDVDVSGTGIGVDEYNSVFELNINGTAGNETVDLTDENDNTITGGGGTDTVNVTKNTDVAGTVVITRTGTDVTVSGTGIGADVYNAIDTVNVAGTTEDETFELTDENDNTITGNGGTDIVNVSSTASDTDDETITIIRTASNVAVTGNFGIGSDNYNDVDQVNITAGGGDDTFSIFDSLDNIFDGGDGIDTANYAPTTIDMSITLDGSSIYTITGTGIGTDILINIENINTGSGNDTIIIQDDADNDINGGGGTDEGTSVMDGVYSGVITIVRNPANVVTVSGTGFGTDVYTDIEKVNVTSSTGDDVFRPNDSNDNDFDADGGTDWIDYSTITGGVSVVVDLSTGTATGDGNDTLTGFENISGSIGDDTLTGDGNANIIDGYTGNDTINAGGGDDTIIGGDGNDDIDGGAGTDFIDESSNGNDLIVNLVNTAGSGYIFDTVAGELDRVDNVENLNTGGGDDTIYVSDSDDNIIDANGGDDVANVSGGTGTITITRTGTDVTVSDGSGSGGIGDDSYLNTETVNVAGSGTDDTFVVDDANDNVFNGLAGDDTISYAALATPITVTIVSNQASISATGIGNDVLYNIENIETGSGDDYFDITGTVDYGLNSNTGADIFDFNGSVDGTLSIQASSSGTHLDFQDYNTGVTIDLSSNTGAVQTIGTGFDVDLTGTFTSISGSDFADNIIGTDAADIIYGGAGADTLTGGDGDDFILGGAGNDIIDGGDGTETVDESANDNPMIVVLSNTAGVGYIEDTVSGEIDMVDNIENVNTGGGDDQFFISDSDDNTIDAGGDTNGDEATVTGGTGTITITRTGSDVTVSDGSGSGGIGDDTYLDVELINVSGSGTDDTFVVDDANDNIFDGSGGDDTISYAPLATPITVTIVSNQASISATSGIGNDTLYNIENIETGTGDDYFDISGTVDYGLDSNSGSDIFDFSAGVNGTLDLGTLGTGSHLDFQDYGEGISIDLTSTADQTIGTGLIVNLSGTFTSISGTAFADAITGTDVADIIYGGAGNDTIFSGDGDDDIDGGAGTDFINEKSNTTGLVVTLSDVLGAGSIVDGAETDTIDNIENIDTGSGLDTFFVSDADNNIINAGGDDDVATVTGGSGIITITRTGDDVDVSGTGIGVDEYNSVFELNVTGSATDDTFVIDDANDNTLDGDAGIDTISYSPVTVPITVTIVGAQATISTTGVGNDVLLNIENIETGSGDDYFDITGTVDYVLNSNSGADIFDFNNSVDGSLALITSDSAELDFSDYDQSLTIDLSSGVSQTVGTGLEISLSGSFTTISGTDFADSIIGTSSADTIFGGDGNDTIDAGAGDDTIDGGDGTDGIDDSSNTNSLIVVLSNITGVGYIEDTVTGEIDSLDNIEDVDTGSGNDQFFISDSDDNTIDAGGGTSDEATVTGGTGTITITRVGNDVTVSDGSGSGGIGDDSYLNLELINVSGSASDDTFVVDDANDNVFDGDAGDDTISYAPLATPITVTIVDNQASISATSGIGADTLYNIENIFTGTGDDYFDISGTVDYGLNSNTGADIFDFADGVNGTLTIGTTGTNAHLDFSSFTSTGINIDLSSGATQNVTGVLDITLSGTFTSISGTTLADNISGTTSADTIWADAGADTIFGDAGADTIYGGGGADVIDGGASGDIIYGGDGDDIIDGFSGFDTIDGGEGNDYIDGSFGTDLIDESANTTGLVVTLSDVAGVGSIVDGLEIDTVDNVENIDAGSGADTFNMGDSDLNIINAGAGSDTVNIQNANDILVTRIGTDVFVTDNATGVGDDEYYDVEQVNISGTSGDDVFQIDDVLDNIIDGQGGTNEIDYSLVTAVINVNVLSGGTTVTSAGIGTDTISNIQNITTGNAADIFVIEENGEDNVLDADAGNDTATYTAAGTISATNSGSSITIETSGGDTDQLDNFETVDFNGSTGDDTFIINDSNDNTIDGSSEGSNGDTYDASFATNSITVSTGASVTAVGTDVGTDTLVDIENITTGSGDDTFIIDTTIGGTFAFDAGESATLGNIFQFTGDGTGTTNITITSSSTATDVLDFSQFTGGGLDIDLNTTTVAAGNMLVTFDSFIDDVIGTDNDDTITGNSLTNNISGGAGNDTINYSAGDDVIDGGAGDDSIDYTGAPDAISATLTSSGTTVSIAGTGETNTLTNIENISGTNNDDTFVITDAVSTTIDAQGGTDTVDYSGLSDAINVDLSTGVGNVSGTSSSEDHTLQDVEDVIGSTFDDTIVGNSDNNTIDGNDGNDSIDGGAGDDVIDGGAGTDTVSYQSASSGVDVDLDSGSSSGGGGNDTLSNIENVSGSTFDDNITGTDGTNVIYGGEGDDDIYGLDGNDTLYGGSQGSVSGTSDDGNDNIYGGAGDDTIYGGNDNTTGGTGNDNSDGGSDVIEGGDGNDDIYGGNNNSGGGSGDDGDDVIEGGADDDTIYGGNNNSGGGSGDDGDDTITDNDPMSTGGLPDDTDIVYGDNNNTSGGSGDAGDDTINVADDDNDDEVTGDNQVDSNSTNDPGTDNITKDGPDNEDTGDGT